MSNLAYHTYVFQAVPALAQIQRQMGGAFITTSRPTYRSTRKQYPETGIHYYNSWPSPILYPEHKFLMAADVLVTGSSEDRFIFQFPGKKVLVYHGTMKFFNRRMSEQSGRFDLVCTIGTRMRDMLSRYPDIQVNAVDSGYLPFMEFPDKASFDRTGFLQSCGLNPTKKTVVYTAAKNKGGSWHIFAKQFVRETPKEFNIILRPHPRSAKATRLSDVLEYRRIGRLCAQRGDALLDMNRQRLSNILAVADMVVSEGTSPTEESLFYDCPQIFVESDKFSKAIVRAQCALEGLHSEDTEKVSSICDLGINFNPLKDNWATTLDKSFSRASDYADARRAYFSYIFDTHDGHAADRVVAAINALVA